MTRLESATLLTIRHPGSFLLLGAVATLVILLVAACGGTTGVEPAETSDVPDVISGGTGSPASVGQDAVVTLYRSPT